MTDALLSLPSHMRTRLASALEADLLAPPFTPMSLRASAGLGEFSQSVSEGLRSLAISGYIGKAAAAWLRGADAASANVRRPDLVWSGPSVSGAFARDTRRVYEELLSTAQRSIIASTYAFFDGPRAFAVVAKRMDECPELKVTLLLNIQRKKNDTTAADQLVRSFTDRFWTTDWPGTRRPALFYDPRALDIDGPSGVLHAKAVVADDESVFVTSANLTEAALDRNIEMGMLVRDRALAASVASHFRVLIEQGLLRPLPAL